MQLVKVTYSTNEGVKQAVIPVTVYAADLAQVKKVVSAYADIAKVYPQVSKSVPPILPGTVPQV